MLEVNVYSHQFQNAWSLKNVKDRHEPVLAISRPESFSKWVAGNFKLGDLRERIQSGTK